jgi:hypothetical protein
MKHKRRGREREKEKGKVEKGKRYINAERMGKNIFMTNWKYYKIFVAD